MNSPSGIILIRPMRAEDIDQVHQIDQLSFTLPWPKSAYRYEIMDNLASLLWVAEVDSGLGGKIVGMVVVWVVLDEAHIATIAVHPDFRGQGIGERLLLTALVGGLEKGAGHAMLEVRDGNQTARQLYHSFGFEIVGRRPRYYRDNQEDAVLMNLKNLDRDKIERIKRHLRDSMPKKDTGSTTINHG